MAMTHHAALSPLRGLATLRNAVRGRESSWNRAGKNRHYYTIPPGATRTLADLEGAGFVTHLWMTTSSPEMHYLRRVLLAMYWDDESTPSVHVPLGDFFGIGHGIMKDFISLPLTMSPRSGRGFNSFFPMPFHERARIDVVNEGCEPLILYFYVDYERHDAISPDVTLFHAQWRRENPTRAVDPPQNSDKVNLDGAENYVILEATGRGHYVGCNLNVDCAKKQWYGEGDDMIFIDGELALHGTGTEDYFNAAYSPSEEYCAPYHGYPLVSHPRELLASTRQGRAFTYQRDYSGKTSMYRFHIEDPIPFQRSILVTIEHGHANALTNDYSSTAYWYQIEPHAPFSILPVENRLPNP